MDNQSFEQQFTQNVRSSAVQPASMEPGGSSKLPLIVSAILAVIVRRPYYHALQLFNRK